METPGDDAMADDAHAHPLAKVRELVDRMKVGMLTTIDDDGTLRSRPLQTLELDDDGALWFFTAAHSPKVEEAAQHRGQVNVAYADPGRQDYLSVSGSAQLVRERAVMEAHWSAYVKAWFPEGLDDPELALLRVVIEKAEYWESPGSAVARWAGLARALATGDRDALGDNEKITFPPRTDGQGLDATRH
jgi:general stress protein 26